MTTKTAIASGVVSTARAEFKRFTKNDWMGLAGAEPFADGSDPLLASIVVDGHEALAIYDASGLFIDISVEDRMGGLDDENWFIRGVEKGPNTTKIALALAMLPAMVTREQLMALGFKKDAR
jgi:hypothetical protein